MLFSDFLKITDLLGKQHKIKTLEGQKWGSDAEQKIVYYFKTDIADLPEEQTLAFLLHEIAHIHYTTKWTNPDENKELRQICMECIEDMAVENLISNDYTNAKDLLIKTMKDVHNKLIDQIDGLNLTKYEKAIIYAELLLNKPELDTEKPYQKAGEKVAKYITTNSQPILNRKKTNDLIPNAEDIMNLLINEMGTPSEEEKKQMEKRLQEAEQGNGSTKNDLKKAMIKEQAGKIGSTAQGKGTHLKKGQMNIDQNTEITDQAYKLGRKLQNILKANNATKYEGKYRQGKLPNKRITRIKTANDKRPFTKKVEVKNKSYAFNINCDVSGSMYGDPITNAISAMYMAAKALKIAKVPRSISHFADYSRTVSKKGTATMFWEDVVEANEGVGGGTDIRNGMYESIKQLDKEKTERKIMIILSDGDDNDEHSIKNAYKEAKKHKIECVGITFRMSKGSALEHAFGKENHIYVPNSKMSEVGNIFAKIIKNKIKKYK